MQVTEVRIKLMEQSEDRLRAFCSITLDQAFVIRDLKIIDGASGPFVAMPSRKLSGHCPRCGYKNHLRAAFCNQCGVKLRIPSAIDSPQKLYADVAHPINSECREMISTAVLTEFEAELKRSHEPGYRPRYDDEFEAISESDDEHFTRIDLEATPVSNAASPSAAGGIGNAARPSNAGGAEQKTPIDKHPIDKQSGETRSRTSIDEPRDAPETPARGPSAITPRPHLDEKQSKPSREKLAKADDDEMSSGFGAGIF